MKNLKKFMFSLLVMVVGIGAVKAADVAGIECERTDLKPGESTVCTISLTPTRTDIETFQVKILTSEYLKVSKVNVNVNQGWTPNTNYSNTTDPTNLTYAFDFKGTVTAGTKMEVFSFTLNLDESAKNITDGECGQLCIDAAWVNTDKIQTTTNACFNPVIKEECTDEDCPPETGAFANYAILGGGALIALIAILAVSKSKRFYRV